MLRGCIPWSGGFRVLQQINISLKLTQNVTEKSREKKKMKDKIRERCVSKWPPSVRREGVREIREERSEEPVEDGRSRIHLMREKWGWR